MLQMQGSKTLNKGYIVFGISVNSLSQTDV